MQKRILGTIIIICTSLILSGCTQINNSSEKEKFIGNWKEVEYSRTFIFLSNGTGTYNNFPIEWDLKDGNLVINFGDNTSSLINHYVFSDNDNTLSLTEINSSTTLVFKKIEECKNANFAAKNLFLHSYHSSCLLFLVTGCYPTY